MNRAEEHGKKAAISFFEDCYELASQIGDESIQATLKKDIESFLTVFRREVVNNAAKKGVTLDLAEIDNSIYDESRAKNDPDGQVFPSAANAINRYTNISITFDPHGLPTVTAC